MRKCFLCNQDSQFVICNACYKPKLMFSLRMSSKLHQKLAEIASQERVSKQKILDRIIEAGIEALFTNSNK